MRVARSKRSRPPWGSALPTSVRIGGGRGRVSPREPVQHCNTVPISAWLLGAMVPKDLTLEAYAASKLIPVDFLRGAGVSEITYLGAPAVRIPYLGPDGSEAAIRFRVGLSGEPRFRWRSGSKPLLYGLSRLDAARRAGRVLLVEGESCAQTLWLHGYPALGLPGAEPVAGGPGRGAPRRHRRGLRRARARRGRQRLLALMEGRACATGFGSSRSLTRRTSLLSMSMIPIGSEGGWTRR